MAKDRFHDAVKNALIKEDWTVTDDPLFLQFLEGQIEFCILLFPLMFTKLFLS